MKRLPLGVQNIDDIITEGYLYIDKTALAHKMIHAGKHFFLARPRGFGKSLYISTLEKIFSGDKEFFKDCAIYNSDYSWPAHPVIHLDFSMMPNRDPNELKQSLKGILTEIAHDYSIKIPNGTPQDILRSLVKELAKPQKVVVLIDEYDQPIISNLDQLDIAHENRRILRSLYATLKGLDKLIRNLWGKLMHAKNSSKI